MKLFRKDKTSPPISLCLRHSDEAIEKGWIDTGATTGAHCRVCQYKSAENDRDKMLLLVSKMVQPTAPVEKFMRDTSEYFISLLTDEEEKIAFSKLSEGLSKNLALFLFAAFLSNKLSIQEGAALSYYYIFHMIGEDDEDK